VVSERDWKILNGTSGCDATFASQKMNAANNASPKKSQPSVVDEVQLCVVVLTTA
jgi:hypothetical protein